MFMMLSVLAAVTAGSPQTAPANAKDSDPIICETSEASEVGTHMRPKRTCLHKSEWEYVRNDTKRELNTLRDKGTLPPPPTGR